MTAPYYALFTDIGVAKLANATATDTPLNITAMGVGDANGVMPTPDPSQTSLINECRRAPLNSLSVDPNNVNQIVAEQVLPDDVGGWWIRELGLYDDEGDLIAVGNCPPSYKPLLEEGAGREQVIRIILIVSSDDAVTLKIDPAVVLATREYVDDAIEAHAKSRNHPDATTSEKGFVQLSSDTDSDDETHAATSKAVKAAYDLANGKLSSVPDATTAQKGIVQLSSATDSDSETAAATPKAIKAVKAIADAALPATGNAASATKLQTARKIAGHDFDGTADITISAGDVGALASGDTAAAATKLATAHKIAGHAFDGTADITIAAGDVGAYTKSESDSHFGSGRTVTGNSNAYYTHQDGTVFMQSVGNIQVGNNVTVTVTLPTSFPNGIIGIGSSYHGTGGNNQASFYLCIPSGKNQVQIQTHNCDGTFYLVVTGW